MATVLNILLISSAVLSIVVGLLVMARDYTKLENISFFGITLGISSWSVGIAGFVNTHNLAHALLWGKFYYFAPLVIVYSSVFFAQEFLIVKRFKLIYRAIVTFLAISLSVALLSPRYSVVKGVLLQSYGKAVLLNRGQYYIYSIYLLFCFVITGYIVYRKGHSFERGLIQRQQADIFLVGYGVSCTFGIFFDLLLPTYGNYSFIIYGPLLSAVFMFTMAYSIVRHKLFDIRLVVARTLGYASALVVVASIYGFAVFGFARLVLHDNFGILIQVYFSSATGIAALFFGKFRKKFDKMTDTIFYRDSYEPQSLFDKLNKVLVSTVNVEMLLKQSSSVITNSLKAQYCAIGLREINGQKIRLFGTLKLSVSPEDINTARHLTTHFRQAVIFRDHLDEKDYLLKDLLTRNNIAVIIRLTTDIAKVKEGLGYIVLGPKLSGNTYTNQDARVLDTIANQMIIAIQNGLHYEEIHNFNITLQSKVNEATNKLRRTNEKLKDLDETKDDFISMASHQLRTPLTSVKGYISMVMEGDAGSINKTQREMLGQAFFSSQRMVYLIADLLNVSRLKSGKFIMDHVQVNLADMVQQELEQLKESAGARQLQLQYEKPADFPDLMLDETKTRQIIMNFIDNAIYYTPIGGHIVVRLINKAATIELRVEDDGIGVPKSEQPHLFTKFYRAGNARKARPDGTGLGLYMAKKVIIAQGGSTIFESQEGKGSTFGFIFSKSAKQVPVPVSSVPDSEKKHTIYS